MRRKPKAPDLYWMMSRSAYAALNPKGYLRLVQMERRQRRARIAPRGR